jgi:hypothetical protein
MTSLISQIAFTNRRSVANTKQQNRPLEQSNGESLMLNITVVNHAIHSSIKEIFKGPHIST